MNINYIYLDITNKCNMDCLYCSKKNISESMHDLDIKLLNKILIWGKRHNANAITLSGGEPALHNNFNLILKEIKNNNYDNLRVMTNGYLFKHNLNNATINLIDEVCFSIDTDIEEANKSIRIGFDNSIINNIDLFHIQYPYVNLTIKSTITNNNKDYIKSLINFSIILVP